MPSLKCIQEVGSFGNIDIKKTSFIFNDEILNKFLDLGKKPVKTKNIEEDLSDSLKDIIGQFKKDFSSKFLTIFPFILD